MQMAAAVDFLGPRRLTIGTKDFPRSDVLLLSPLEGEGPGVRGRATHDSQVR
jgi:hypothetical protein